MYNDMSTNVNYLNVVKNFTHLPDHQPIQQFYKYLSRFGQSLEALQNMSCCFILVPNFHEALFVISITFGRLELLDQLSKYMQKSVLLKVEKKLQKYLWDQDKSAFKIFQNNAKEFGSQYPFFKTQILSKITEQQTKLIYTKAKQSSHLHGVKIRVWPQSSDKNSKLGQFVKRNSQKDQLRKIGDANYLLITKSADSSFIVGFLYHSQEILSQNTFQIKSTKSQIQLGELGEYSRKNEYQGKIKPEQIVLKVEKDAQDVERDRETGKDRELDISRQIKIDLDIDIDREIHQNAKFRESQTKAKSESKGWKNKLFTCCQLI